MISVPELDYLRTMRAPPRSPRQCFPLVCLKRGLVDCLRAAIVGWLSGGTPADPVVVLGHRPIRGRDKGYGHSFPPPPEKTSKLEYDQR